MIQNGNITKQITRLGTRVAAIIKRLMAAESTIKSKFQKNDSDHTAIQSALITNNADHKVIRDKYVEVRDELEYLRARVEALESLIGSGG